jgi:hypothetical protein
MADHKQAALIAATLMLAREVAHREHLKVTGPGAYSQHAGALGPFYEEIGGLADTFVEVYQGCFDCILDIPLVSHDTKMPIAEFLRKQQKWIRKTRYQAVPKDESPLQNIIDEIESLYFSTLYKLKRLQ